MKHLIFNTCFQVYASPVISLLQADIKTALKSAFDALDGPLSVTDWCKGRNQSGEAGNTGDGYSAESTISELSSAAVSIGEPMSPSQTSGGSSGLKGINIRMHLCLLCPFFSFFFFYMAINLTIWRIA